MSSVLSPTDKLIRKLRKKLRQIEQLELLGRSSLNDEEKAKVKQKNAIRLELAQLLKTVEVNAQAQKSKVEKQTVNKQVAETSERDGISPLNHDNPSQDESVSKTMSNSDDQLNLPNLRKLVTEKKQELVHEEPNLDNSVLLETMKRSASNNEVSSNNETTANKTGQKKKAKPSASPLKQEMKNNQDATVTSKTDAKASLATKSWHESSSFLMNNLEAHNDLVVCVDFDEDFVISGSRDTCVQVWCTKTGCPLMNLRGHTNTVTCVTLLSSEQSKILYATLFGETIQEKTPRLVITGSLDCCLKLWDVENGTALRSIYTFSGITALCYFPSRCYCVVGSEGGKLELYSFLEDVPNPLFSLKTFENSVSSIKIQDDNLVCSSFDGYISVWLVREAELSRVYNSEDLISESNGPIFHRPVLCLAVSVSQPVAFYGDEGATVKMLSWRTGVVRKLRNHTADFGITHSVAATQSFLLSSSLDLDTGNSFINVRSLPDLNYLGTLNIPNIGRILCLAAIEDKATNTLRMVIGGTKLVLVETRGIGCRRSPKKDSILKPEIIHGLTLPVADSEGESSCSSDEMDEEVEENNDQAITAASESIPTSSWCLIL